MGHEEETEWKEAKRAGKLALRGFCLVSLAALLAALPFDAFLAKLPLLVIAGFLLVYAVSALTLSLLGLRNILGRLFSLQGRIWAIHALSIVLAAGFALLGWALFAAIGSFVTSG